MTWNVNDFAHREHMIVHLNGSCQAPPYTSNRTTSDLEHQDKAVPPKATFPPFDLGVRRVACRGRWTYCASVIDRLPQRVGSASWSSVRTVGFAAGGLDLALNVSCQNYVPFRRVVVRLPISECALPKCAA